MWQAGMHAANAIHNLGDMHIHSDTGQRNRIHSADAILLLYQLEHGIYSGIGSHIQVSIKGQGDPGIGRFGNWGIEWHIIQQMDRKFGAFHRALNCRTADFPLALGGVTIAK